MVGFRHGLGQFELPLQFKRADLRECALQKGSDFLGGSKGRRNVLVGTRDDDPCNEVINRLLGLENLSKEHRKATGADLGLELLRLREGEAEFLRDSGYAYQHPVQFDLYARKWFGEGPGRAIG